MFHLLDLIRQLTASWFKTLEHSINYLSLAWPKKEEKALSETLYTVCLQQHKPLMTFKADPDQDHPRPLPQMKLGALFNNFSKKLRWFQNVMHNV